MSLISRDMQIKTTMRNYFIPVRMATIRKIIGEEKKEPCTPWWEYKSVHPLWKPIWKFL
jgi:hypothetical protein